MHLKYASWSFCTASVQSLSAYRVGLGFLLLVDLFARVQKDGVRAHYTNDGIAPIGQVQRYFPFEWSIHAMNGTVYAQWALFLVQFFCALCFLLGFKTRKSAFACWALWVSMHSRNNWINNGGDRVMSKVLFFSMFLPLGATYSLDTVQRQVRFPAYARRSTSSWWVMCIVVEMSLHYGVAGWLKTSTMWRDGSATWSVLVNGPYTSDFGRWMSQVVPISWFSFLTYGVLWWERIGWIGLWMPRRVRNGTIALFMFMHLGFGTCLVLGMFPWFSVVCLLALWRVKGDDARCNKQKKNMKGSQRESVAGIFFMIFTVVCVVFKGMGYVFPDALRVPAGMLRFEHSYTMFAGPKIDRIWFAAVGSLEQTSPFRVGFRTRFDVLRDAEITMSVEEYIQSLNFKTQVKNGVIEKVTSDVSPSFLGNAWEGVGYSRWLHVFAILSGQLKYDAAYTAGTRSVLLKEKLEPIGFYICAIAREKRKVGLMSIWAGIARMSGADANGKPVYEKSKAVLLGEYCCTNLC